MPQLVTATTFSASSLSRHNHRFTYSGCKSFDSYSLQPLIFSRKFHPHRPSLHVGLLSGSNTRSLRCLSAGPGPPYPPDADPPRPPGGQGLGGIGEREICKRWHRTQPCWNPHPKRGFAVKVSGFQDRAQIFFAVLFWMSLFFWSSAWDGRNSDRTNKGSRFRR